MLSRGGHLIVCAGVLFLGTLAFSECSKPAPQRPQPVAPPLLGEMTPVVSVKELMGHMIDPIADNIFDAVWWEVTAKGLVEHRPRTDDDWEKVKVGAVSLAEGIYLLNVPRPLAPPGDLNDSLGPNPPELSPTQIKAKIDKDPVLWIAKIQALRNVGLEVLEVVKKKDVDALFNAGGDLDEACEACHLEYWYPGDKMAVLEYKKGRARFKKPGTPGIPATPAKK
jgi:hypothetical protein